MTTTLTAIERRVPEFDTICLGCGGPLLAIDHHTLAGLAPGMASAGPVHVHARHRDWACDPHPAEPLPTDYAAVVTDAARLLRAAGH